MRADPKVIARELEKTQKDVEELTTWKEFIQGGQQLTAAAPPEKTSPDAPDLTGEIKALKGRIEKVEAADLPKKYVIRVDKRMAEIEESLAKIKAALDELKK